MKDQIGRKDPIHGNIYQLKLLMLFLYRGVKLEYSFHLGTEIEQAKKFDDLVFKYTKDNQIFYRLLQAKHTLSEDSKIQENSLLTHSDSDYSLFKYFFSYQESKADKFFKRGSFQDIIICTNKNFDLPDLTKSGIKLEHIQDRDDIFDTNCVGESGRKQPKRYKFHDSFVDLFKSRLEEYYPTKLAKNLINCILCNKMITPQKPVFQIYQNVLAYEVIDVDNKKFHDCFIKKEQLSKSGEEFREVFIAEVRKESECKLSLEKINEDITNKRIINGNEIGLKLRKDFGKDKNSKWPENVFSVEHVKDFLKHLVFAVDQPNEDELGNAIKKEIGNGFNEITTEHVYNKIFNRMLNFMQGKYRGKKFHSHEEGKKLIEDARKEIISIQRCNYKNHLDSVPFRFSLDNELKTFVSSAKHLWLLPSETPWLSSLVLHQSLMDGKEGDYKFGYYNFKWIDLLGERGKFLSDFSDLNEWLIIITCLQASDNDQMAGDIADMVHDILSGESHVKKIIVIASANHKFIAALKEKFKLYYEEELRIELCNMDETSVKMLMETENIHFQNYPNKLSINQLLGSEQQNSLSTEQIQNLNLNASALEILLKESDIKMWHEYNQIGDSNSVNYKPNMKLSDHQIEETITAECSDKFVFLGNMQEIQEFFVNRSSDIIMFNKMRSSDEFINHRFILLNSESEKEEFNQLCILSNNSSLEPVLHKIKRIMGEWIWVQTYAQGFYIPRFFNPVLIRTTVTKLLDISDQFIVFSGMDKSNLLDILQSQDERCNTDENCFIETPDESAEGKFQFLKKIIERKEEDKHKGLKISQLNITRIEAVHWIKAWEAEGRLQLEWYQSAGDVTEISKLAIILSESAFVKITKRVVILADDPGKGKTSTFIHLTELLKREKLKSIVLKIDLKILKNLFASSNGLEIPGIVEFILRMGPISQKNALTQRVLEYKLGFPEQVFLLCDGFDELSIKEKNSILAWFKSVMEETKASIWITTRINDKKELENFFSVFSFSFQPLNEMEQINYLTKFWKTILIFFPKIYNFNLKLAACEVRRHYDQILLSKDSVVFVGFPLMLRMLAEKYFEVLRGSINKRSDYSSFTLRNEIRKVNCLDTYESFVRHKYELYFDEKMGVKERLDKDSQHILSCAYTEAYARLAAKQRFDERIELNLRNTKKELSASTLSRIGLIRKLDDDKMFFIDGSFEIYFATEFVCTELKWAIDPKIWSFLLNDILIHPFGKRFFDFKLGTDNIISKSLAGKKEKRIVYDLLLEQVASKNRHVALWQAGDANLKNVFRFLLKSVNSHANLQKLFEYQLSTCMLENMDEFVEDTMAIASTLCSERILYIVKKERYPEKIYFKLRQFANLLRSLSFEIENEL